VFAGFPDWAERTTTVYPEAEEPGMFRDTLAGMFGGGVGMEGPRLCRDINEGLKEGLDNEGDSKKSWQLIDLGGGGKRKEMHSE
jgi:hypothetical protein